MKIIAPVQAKPSPLRAAPILNRPDVPIPVMSQPGQLTDLAGVASALGVSKRYVQTLVSRKVIPVIRLGRRCTRFDLDGVRAAIKRFEIHEVGR